MYNLIKDSLSCLQNLTASAIIFIIKTKATKPKTTGEKKKKKGSAINNTNEIINDITTNKTMNLVMRLFIFEGVNGLLFIGSIYLF